MTRTRSESGQLGGIEGVAFGLLVFVVGSLIIANAWSVIDAKLAASAAAREAARAFVESDAAGADEAALSAARAALEGYGRDPDRMQVVRDGTGFGRCQRVTFEVEYPVALGAVPLIGRAAMTFVAAARHSEVVDPFRDGLPGEARCA
jgi:hypothetical protein